MYLSSSDISCHPFRVRWVMIVYQSRHLHIGLKLLHHFVVVLFIYSTLESSAGAWSDLLIFLLQIGDSSGVDFLFSFCSRGAFICKKSFTLIILLRRSFLFRILGIKGDVIPRNVTTTNYSASFFFNPISMLCFMKIVVCFSIMERWIWYSVLN